MSDDLIVVRREDLAVALEQSFSGSLPARVAREFADRKLEELTEAVPQFLTVPQAQDIYVARHYADPREHLSGQPRGWLELFSKAGLGFVHVKVMPLKENEDDG